MEELEAIRQQLIEAINKDCERAFYLKQDKMLGNVTNVISTQAPSIDRIIAKDIKGRWGIPCGRTTFIVGEPSVGKTSLCLHVCAEAQRRGGIAYFIDGEHRFDEEYAKNIGVDTDSLIISKPTTLEEGLDEIQTSITHINNILEENIRKSKLKDKKKAEQAKAQIKLLKKIPIAIILDSVSIKTEAELGGRKEKGGHARAVSEAMRSMIPDIARLNIAVIFVCQRKSKINIGSWGGYGPQETMLAESALRFHCTVGLKMMKIKTLRSGKDGDNKIGDIIKVISTKNSCLPPFQTGTVEIYYGKGIDYYVSLCDTLEKYYGAKKVKRTYHLKKLGIQWTDKRGLKKLFEKDPKAKKKVQKLLTKPTKTKIKIES